MEDISNETYMQDLLCLDPGDWNNIPPPVIAGIKVLKNTIRSQGTTIMTLDRLIKQIEGKMENKLRTVQKSMSSIQEDMFKVEERALQTVSAIEDKTETTLMSARNQLTQRLDEKIEDFKKQFLNLKHNLEETNEKIEKIPIVHPADISKIAKDMDDILKKNIIERNIAPGIEDLFAKIERTATDFESKLWQDSRNNELKINKISESLSENNTDLTKKVMNTKQSLTELIEKANEDSKENFSDFIRRNNQILTEIQKNYDNKIENLTKSNEGLMGRIENTNSSMLKHSRQIKKLKNQVQTSLKDIESLRSPPESPVHPDSYVPSFSNFQEDIDKFREEILGEVQQEIILKIQENMREIPHTIQKYAAPIKSFVDDRISEIRVVVKELKEKLAWLPINLEDIGGMNATEARLFTIEARLRLEENNRLQIREEIDKYKVQEFKKPKVFTRRRLTRPSTRTSERPFPFAGISTPDVWNHETNDDENKQNRKRRNNQSWDDSSKKPPEVYR